MYRIFLSEKVVSLIDRRVTGTGGWQDLMRMLQKRYRNKDKSILLSDDDISRIKKYYSYGASGGYQQRLGALIRFINAQTDDNISSLDSFGFQ